MNRYYLIYLITICIVLGCSTTSKNVIIIENTLNIERIDELVRIPITRIDTHIPDINDESILVMYNQNNEPIPFQLEDIDHDKNWDQLIFVIDFKPKEIKEIHYDVIKRKKVPIASKTTDIHFGVGSSPKDVKEVETYKRNGDPRNVTDKKFFQMEGPAWENDKVGFRMYFDPRNGIDIFGKTTKDLVLSKVGINGDYHTKEDWGMDILKVGNSLGAGSIAIQLNDSLYRVTGKNGAIYKTIDEGPIKASFEMNYTNDTIQGVPVQIQHRISIYKGQWYYKSEVSLSGITPEMKLVAGIVNLKPNQLYTEERNNLFSIYSHGKQSEHGDHLGMALLLNKNLYYTHKTTANRENGITNTHFVTFNTENNTPIPFYFLSGWEASSPKFGTKEGFSKEITETLKKFSHPIIIK